MNPSSYIRVDGAEPDMENLSRVRVAGVNVVRIWNEAARYVPAFLAQCGLETVDVDFAA